MVIILNIKINDYSCAVTWEIPAPDHAATFTSNICRCRFVGGMVHFAELVQSVTHGSWYLNNEYSQEARDWLEPLALEQTAHAPYGSLVIQRTVRCSNPNGCVWVLGPQCVQYPCWEMVWSDGRDKSMQIEEAQTDDVTGDCATDVLANEYNCHIIIIWPVLLELF